MECTEAVPCHLTHTELHQAKKTRHILNFLRQERSNGIRHGWSCRKSYSGGYGGKECVWVLCSRDQINLWHWIVSASLKYIVTSFRLTHNFSFNDYSGCKIQRQTWRCFQVWVMQFSTSTVSCMQFLREANKPVLANSIWFLLPDQGIPGLPSNCITNYASENANLLIVMKAAESASAVKSVLIGDDTNLLILHFYHTSLDSVEIFLKPEPR